MKRAVRRLRVLVTSISVPKDQPGSHSVSIGRSCAMEKKTAMTVAMKKLLAVSIILCIDIEFIQSWMSH